MYASTIAAVDLPFIYILAFSFLLFGIIIFLMLFFVFRYRRSRNPNPSDISGNVWVETAWIAASVILALTMFWYGLTGFTYLKKPPTDSMKIQVTGRQWSWLFTYDSGKKSPTLVVPQGKDVELDMKSADVIHGFFIPAYRIKMDLLPTMVTRVWFHTASLGSADILCTQYCGLLHAKMLSKVVVVSPQDYEQWLAGNLEVSGEESHEQTPGEKLVLDAGCLSCHSLDGSRVVGPTFKGLFGSTVQVTTAGKQRSVAADPAYLRASITDPGADVVVGYKDMMPSSKDTLTDQQITQIIEYLKTLD